MCASSAVVTDHGDEQERDVHLQLKHGVEAKNYDDVRTVAGVQQLVV